MNIFSSFKRLIHIESILSSVYPHNTHQKVGELALVGYPISNGTQPFKVLFVCNISMHSHFMVKLERDTFECAGNRLNLSTNPFQFCLPHLVVNGKALLNQTEFSLIMPDLSPSTKTN